MLNVVVRNAMSIFRFKGLRILMRPHAGLWQVRAAGGRASGQFWNLLTLTDCRCELSSSWLWSNSRVGFSHRRRQKKHRKGQLSLLDFCVSSVSFCGQKWKSSHQQLISHPHFSSVVYQHLQSVRVSKFQNWQHVTYDSESHPTIQFWNLNARPPLCRNSK